MVPALRDKYNQQFTNDQYQAFIHELTELYPGQLDFRVAETPVYVDKEFSRKMLSACESIIDVVSAPQYHQQSRKAIPSELVVPGEDEHPHCIAFDFGVCTNHRGELEPQLIEMQAFPTLFAWQLILPRIHAKHFWTPEGYSPFFNGFDQNSYIDLLRRTIIGDAQPENVILLELFPHLQKTRVDFTATREILGIHTVDLKDLIQEGRKLFYLREGKKVPVERIYNRIIFDELQQQSEDIRKKGRIFLEDLDVTWVPHPNWFFRISKYTLPFIKHPFVPATQFLSEFTETGSLENFVVKPLFSFAGQGVIIDVTKAELEKIVDRENWIIQKKVNYAPVIRTPAEPAKAEIRIFYFWDKGAQRPVAANQLCRLSKGKMIGVRYNKDKEWVGGSFCLVEQ